MTAMGATAVREGAADATSDEVASHDTAGLDDERVLDLAQQGMSIAEIADLLAVRDVDVEAALTALVPGGAVTIWGALRRRLRAWSAAHPSAEWLDAESVFGVPHVHLLRLARVPVGHEVAEALPGESGYLDSVIAGQGCRDDRAASAARWYAGGATLQEIGDRFDVTRERIRQILTTSTPWSSTELAGVLRALREARRSEHTAAALAWSETNPAAPIAAAVTSLGLSQEQVLAALGRRRTMHEAAMASSGSQRRPDAALLEDLRQFHAETGVTTTQAYARWAKAHDVPGHQTVMSRFGTWNDALREAGIADVKGAPRSAFSDDDLWAAAIAAIRTPGVGTTHASVSRWLSTQRAAPSAILIRKRLNLGWNEIANRALAVINGAEGLDPVWVAAVTTPRDWDAAPEQVEPEDHVRAAIVALGTSIRSETYRVWAQENGRPTAPTLMRRSGKTWRQLVKDSGGDPGRAKVKGRTREEVGEHVARFLASHPRGGSEQYTAWAKEHDAASLSTVVDRFGTWSRALEDAKG